MNPGRFGITLRGAPMPPCPPRWSLCVLALLGCGPSLGSRTPGDAPRLDDARYDALARRVERDNGTARDGRLETYVGLMIDQFWESRR
jgi:hypothetical protein